MSILSRAQRLLTNLAILLPISLASQSAIADVPTQCPGSLVYYGGWAGGYCCDGTYDAATATCNGNVCALDPDRTQGNPLCYQENSATCRNMGSHHFYGGLQGGFCCDGSLDAGKINCNGNVCAVSAANTWGNPVCQPLTAQCPTGLTRYAEWLGGFCCDGIADPGGASCDGSVCALDPTSTWGNPMCSDYVRPPQGSQGGMRYFSSNLSGGTPFRFFTATGSVQTTSTGVSIAGDVTIVPGDDLPEISLGNAQLDLEFDSEGYIDRLIGSAHVTMPPAGGFEMDDIGVVTIGFDWGSNINNPESIHHVEAPMKDDRQYVVFHLASGLSGSFGPVSLSAPGGTDTVLVVDPRDPSVYFHGDLSAIPGLSALDDVGIGVSVQGLLPFDYENTWGIEQFLEEFDGNVLLEGPIPFANPLLSADGEMTVRLPSASDPTTRVGFNGNLDFGINFVPNIATFSVNAASASLSGTFDGAGQSDLVFSTYAGTQGFINSLPSLTVMPGIGTYVAGRLSTTAADNFLRVSGYGSFGGQPVVNLDLWYVQSGVWASGTFRLGGGFYGNLIGQVTATSADLRGEAYMSIPIYGAKQIVSGTWQTMNYVKNAAECGWATTANAAECGWQDFTDCFCMTFPWLCTPQPRTCTYANSCTKDVWVQQTITEPNFNYGAFTAKANFQVSTPQNINVDFGNQLCPASVGTCSASVRDLNTTSPKLCVTSSVFGMFCQPLTMLAAVH